MNLARGEAYRPHHGFLKKHASFGSMDQVGESIQGLGYESASIDIEIHAEASLFRHFGVIKDKSNQLLAPTLRAIEFQLGSASQLEAATHEYISMPIEAYYDATAIYASHGNYGVYSHFLFETATTSFLMRRELENESIGIIIPSGHGWMLQVLEAIGVPTRKVLPLQHNSMLIKNLIVSSTCTGESTFAPNRASLDMATYIKNIHCDTEPSSRRLFLNRKNFSNTGSRDFKGERQLEQLLERHGFLSINPATLSFTQQVHLFAQAECVIGAHGSAFAGLLFAPKGCIAIDILPSHWANIGGCFTANLTNLCDQFYFPIVGNSVKNNAGWSFDVSATEVEEKCLQALKDIL